MAEIKTSIDGAVATVLFSNPAKMNAMSYDMWHAVPKVFAQLDANPAVRVIVCAGEGEKAFISGADISQFEKLRGTVEAHSAPNCASGVPSCLGSCEDTCGLTCWVSCWPATCPTNEETCTCA